MAFRVKSVDAHRKMCQLILKSDRLTNPSPMRPAKRGGGGGGGNDSSDEEDLFAVYSDVLATNLRLVGRRYLVVHPPTASATTAVDAEDASVSRRRDEGCWLRVGERVCLTRLPPDPPADVLKAHSNKGHTNAVVTQINRADNTLTVQVKLKKHDSTETVPPLTPTQLLTPSPPHLFILSYAVKHMPPTCPCPLLPETLSQLLSSSSHHPHFICDDSSHVTPSPRPLIRTAHPLTHAHPSHTCSHILSTGNPREDPSNVGGSGQSKGE